VAMFRAQEEISLMVNVKFTTATRRERETTQILRWEPSFREAPLPQNDNLDRCGDQRSVFASRPCGFIGSGHRIKEDLTTAISAVDFETSLIASQKSLLQRIFLQIGRGRDGRVAEGARLESVFTRKGNVGSNPTLSAIFSMT
jgi:hypothetical protein